MSRTYHHIQNKLFWRNYWKDPKNDWHDPLIRGGCKGVPHKYFTDYSKNPSWWNRLFNRRPKRRQDTLACTAIVNRKIEAERAEFSLSSKPNNWYW